MSILNHHALNIVEARLVAAPIIELRGARRGVVRHRRGLFERHAILQLGCDARCSKRVVANLRCDGRRPRSPLNHRIGVRLGQGFAVKLAGSPAAALEQQSFWVAREPRQANLLAEPL